MPRGIPNQKPKATDDVAAPAIVAHKVYIHAFSSGPRGSLEAVPLHEIPLMRRKLEVFGESLSLSSDWPDFVPHERAMTAVQLREEHARLTDKYQFKGNDGKDYDLVQDVYGPSHQGRLIAVMRRQHKAWNEGTASVGGAALTIEQLEDLVQLANPESDFIEAELQEV